MSKQMIYMNLFIVLATVVAFIYFVGKAKIKENKAAALKQKRKLHNRFSFYYNNVIIRGPFRRIVEMYASLSCYDSDTVKEESVKLFEKNVAIVILLPVVALIVMKDALIAILMAFMGYVYYESTVEKENDKIYVKLMEDCSMTISSVREKYLETDNIPLAILYAEKSKYLEAPMHNIYRILTDTDGAERLEKFQHSYPVAIIKTFANTCYIVNENGAVKHENGADSFSEDMTTLRQECDSEIRRLTKQKIAFNSLQMLSLAGLVIMPAFEWYLLTQIPGTASLLKGFYGLAIHVAVMLTTMFSYHYISTSCRPSVVNQIDKTTWIDQLSKNKKVRDFVEEISPKKYRTTVKLKSLLDDSLSAKDVRYIYTSKPIYSIAGFVAAFVVLLFGTITVRDNFYNNYNSLSFIPQTVTETQHNQIVRMDNDFMELKQDEYEAYDDETLQSYIKGRITGISDSDASEQVKRLRKKYEGYHGAHYYWWWWLVCYAVAVLCWFVPEITLKVRKKMVAYEATNDVSQLQTMMIVLSETKMDVYKALCWLEKQAAVHKAAIRKCHYSYIADPIAALEKLEKSSPVNDFKRLLRKLKSSVYTLSLHDAFSDMALDKAQTLTITEMLRGEELEQRKNSAKLIAVAPAALALIGCFIGPVLILGVSEMVDTLNNLSNFGG
jgi:hypothetical protein